MAALGAAPRATPAAAVTHAPPDASQLTARRIAPLPALLPADCRAGLSPSRAEPAHLRTPSSEAPGGRASSPLPSTPRTRARKSQPELCDEPEAALLSGRGALGTGSRARQPGRRRVTRPLTPRAQLETPSAEADDAPRSEAYGRASPGISDLLLGAERSDAGYTLGGSPRAQRSADDGEASATAVRSADDCAAASALAMLFECANRVEEQGA